MERARRYDDELRRANTKPVGAELHRRALLKELDDVVARNRALDAHNRRLCAENDTLHAQLDAVKSQRDTYAALSNQPVRAVH